MTDDITTAEENLDDEISIEEEFRALYGDAESIKERWAKIAKTKDEEGQKEIATLLRLISGDVLQLLQDTISTTALAAAPEGEAGEETLDEEEVEQIYATLHTNTEAFKQLLLAIGTSGDAESVQKIQKLIDMNEETLLMLRENYGEELAQDALETIKQAVEGTVSEQ
jgi:hypothetical protein